MDPSAAAGPALGPPVTAWMSWALALRAKGARNFPDQKSKCLRSRRVKLRYSPEQACLWPGAEGGFSSHAGMKRRDTPLLVRNDPDGRSKA